MKKIVLTMVLCIITFGVMMAQIKVSGTVTDASGKEVSGVLVTEKGTKNGTVTNLQGKYELELPNENAVLEFLMIGVDRIEKACKGKTQLDVQLREVIDENDTSSQTSTIILYDKFGKKISEKKEITLIKEKLNFSDFMSESEFNELAPNTYFYLIKKGKEQETGYLIKEKEGKYTKGGKIQDITYKWALIKRKLRNKKIYLDIDGNKTLLKDGIEINGAKIELNNKYLKINGAIPYKKRASIWFGNKEFHIDGTRNTDICNKMKILSNGEKEENLVFTEEKETPSIFIVDKNGEKDNSILYIIDGEPISNEKMIKEIASDSIEQISVLKGETAIAVYGERGKNGVVIITTKKNKE